MTPLWKEIRKSNFRNWEKLASFLELENKTEILKNSPFPLNLPRRLAEKICKKSLHDPILKQFLPHQKEQIQKEGYLLDPLEESRFKKSSSLIQKYQRRALLITSSACAMHCRYCFRRNYPYENSITSFEKELSLIQGDPTIEEVILSGGDPLSLDNEHLGALLKALDQIPHIQIIRFHSRFLIGIPERIDEGFLHLIRQSKKRIVFVLHCNHPGELDEDIFYACRLLQNENVLTFCQSVLLRDINDDLKTLERLSYSLITNGVIPYYLHQLDPVEGSSHFYVDVQKGLRLIDELKKIVPGYALFRYVKEIPGQPYKVEITSGQRI